MPFKTIRPSSPLVALAGFSTLEFGGADCTAFLQAQTMNDVAGVAVGQWQWNGWLTAKGRVVALFALARLGETEWLAVLPDVPAAELMGLLQRFVFRLKVRMTAGPDTTAAAEWPNHGSRESIAAPARVIGSRESGLGLAIGTASTPRTLWLVDHAKLAPLSEPGLDDAWLRADMAMGLPRLSPAQREAWTPQMLSLDRLRAFSLKKGCYPGQEIVARTHYLGQARRRLSRIVGRHLAEGDTVGDEGGKPLGVVIRALADGSEGIAVIQADFDGLAAVVGGHAAGLPDFEEVGESFAV